MRTLTISLQSHRVYANGSFTNAKEKVMATIRQHLKSARELYLSVKAAKAELDVSEQKLRSTITEIEKACEPCFIKAAATFNEQSRTLLINHSVRAEFGLNIKERTIIYKVRLTWPSGMEPDEDLSSRDIEPVQERFCALMNAELKAAQIPLTAGKLTVPYWYYAK